MKQKIIIISILFSLFCSTLYAQHAIGSWQNYLSYHNVTQTEPAGNIVYALGNGSLFAYDKEDTSIQRYWKNYLLTDTDIAKIAYQSSYKTLVIIYSNANIDLLVNDESVYNLPDYMNKNMTFNKNVNHICFNNEYAYLSTSFGVIVLNLKKKEISNTYILNKSINACAIENGRIYAASSEGLFTGILTDNLLDVNNWNKISDIVYNSLSNYNGNLVGNILGAGIYVINQVDYSYSQLIGGNYRYLYTYTDKLIAGNDNSLALFKNINSISYLDHYLGIAHLSYQNGIYWAGGREKGLMGLKYNETTNTMQTVVSPIIPNSPIRNLPNYLKFEGNRLFVTGCGDTSPYTQPGTIMMLENNTWSSFQEKGISEKTGVEYNNISSIAEDPTDNKHHFASSATEGLYEFYDNKFVKLYTYTNSPLKVASPITNPDLFKNFVRVNGLTYNNNNLWMLNCESYNPIHVLKPNKEWVSLHYPEITDITSFKYIYFDKKNWLWAVATNYINKSGIFCLNTNGTLEKTADDQHKFIKNFTNQDGTALGYIANCMAIDKEGTVWVGTDHGPLLFNNPSNFFNNTFTCTQVKIPRNDGTNLADFLLVNDLIQNIAIDGANRKWVGTEKNGIYLLSPDGMETIHHFTSENSPLISNNISFIAIHPKTGEVFIGTNKGLVSYQSDATEAGENFSDDIYAYPNPVNPDYTGVITVVGLVQDSNVKIINVHGKLIHTGTSLGGQFTWNGRNNQGNKVPSGIYFVLAADKNGNEGVATKIMIIK